MVKQKKCKKRKRKQRLNKKCIKNIKEKQCLNKKCIKKRKRKRLSKECLKCFYSFLRLMIFLNDVF